MTSVNMICFEHNMEMIEIERNYMRDMINLEYRGGVLNEDTEVVYEGVFETIKNAILAILKKIKELIENVINFFRKKKSSDDLKNIEKQISNVEKKIDNVENIKNNKEKDDKDNTDHKPNNNPKNNTIKTNDQSEGIDFYYYNWENPLYGFLYGAIVRSDLYKKIDKYLSDHTSFRTFDPDDLEIKDMVVNKNTIHNLNIETKDLINEIYNNFCEEISFFNFINHKKELIKYKKTESLDFNEETKKEIITLLNRKDRKYIKDIKDIKKHMTDLRNSFETSKRNFEETEDDLDRVKKTISGLEKSVALFKNENISQFSELHAYIKGLNIAVTNLTPIRTQVVQLAMRNLKYNIKAVDDYLDNYVYGI